MLTSSATIVHQKASVPISPINGYGPAASLHHPALEPNLSSQPQSPLHASPAAVSSTTNTSVLVPELTLQGALPATLGPTVSHQESNGSLPVRIKRPQPQEQDHTQRRQSTALYFQPKDSDRRLSCEDLPQGLLTPEDSNNQNISTTTTAPMMTTFEPKDQHQQDMTHHHHYQHSHHQQQHHEDKKLVVRLDLRKLGSNGMEARPSSKKLSTHRHSIRKRSLEGPASTGVQPTLGAHSWAHAKSVQNGSHNDSPTLYGPVEPRQEQQPQPPTAVSVPDATLVQEEGKDTSLLQPSTTTSANAISISTTITEASTPDSELRADLQNEGDLDCVATSSRSMKRSNSSGSWTDQTNKKRTRSSNQGGAKKNKVMEERRPQQESQLQEGPALKKKGSLKQMAKASPTPSAPAPAPAVPAVAAVDQSKDVAHAGDDTTVD
ncbi:hypothetical protein BGZ91_006717, partial [Linnemannia elongata]